MTGPRAEYVFSNRPGRPIDNKNFVTRIWQPLISPPRPADASAEPKAAHGGEVAGSGVRPHLLRDGTETVDSDQYPGAESLGGVGTPSMEVSSIISRSRLLAPRPYRCAAIRGSRLELPERASASFRLQTWNVGYAAEGQPPTTYVGQTARRRYRVARLNLLDSAGSVSKTPMLMCRKESSALATEAALEFPVDHPSALAEAAR